PPLCYPLSLHDALPIFPEPGSRPATRAMETSWASCAASSSPGQCSDGRILCWSCSRLHVCWCPAELAVSGDRSVEPVEHRAKVSDRKSTRLNSSHQIIS